MSYRKLGDLVKFVSNKNTDGNATVLFGINIDKFFMPSVANIIGVDLKKYKVVERHQFACNRMHVGRDERLPISMSTFDYNFIVSPAYDVFEVITSDVLPEYLMLWFRRKEFDRQCWFYTDADVRGGLHLDALKSIEIKVPSIEEQRQIVAQYQSIANKIKVNEQICEKLEATAQALYKYWFVDFEFPNEEGKVYKSSGGTMVWSEELGKEIPEGWEVGKIKNFAKIKNGYAFKSDWWEEKGLPVIKIGSIQNGYVQLKELGFISDVHKLNNINKGDYGDIVIAMTGATIGKIGLIIGDFKEYLINQRVGLFNLINKYYKSYLYFSLCQDWFNYEIQNVGGDSAQANVSDKQILNISIVKPNEEILKSYHNYCKDLIKMKLIISSQTEKLTQLQSLLLSRLATLEW
ncbi:restriction endonuclease subunit S [Chryseobacterium sp. MFBS3-17]|uniref:restriction endonuclease subunit S n=1 Tax=Chryseobacterium sp. MFBS3-17 TaxID=2886689 RepID=UPI001D0E94FB|nr:restriction endonuclease subunit S [Chryseobacterium sp. MFBS3-17]MCC2589355.1 restriction endonuclease subunit S [Chryseobacterium sp. MFBS3-17]